MNSQILANYIRRTSRSARAEDGVHREATPWSHSLVDVVDTSANCRYTISLLKYY